MLVTKENIKEVVGDAEVTYLPKVSFVRMLESYSCTTFGDSCLRINILGITKYIIRLHLDLYY